jgi:DNA processing protein
VGTFVVEGTMKSGSMITARYAADQGKDVYIAPMPITSILSEGPLSLFRSGARMVTSPEEILSDYGISEESHFQKKIYATSEEEKKVLEMLAGNDFPLDTIAEQLKISISDLSFSLTSLELKGFIMKTLSGTYQRIS